MFVDDSFQFVIIRLIFYTTVSRTYVVNRANILPFVSMLHNFISYRLHCVACHFGVIL